MVREAQGGDKSPFCICNFQVILEAEEETDAKDYPGQPGLK